MITPETVRALEAIVLVATDPVPPTLLAQLLEIPVTEVERLCAELADELRRGRPRLPTRSAWPAATATRATPTSRPTSSGSCSKVSRPDSRRAALETLAIVAYKQPVSRAQVAAIRGVDPDAVLRTLQQRGYIDQVGRDPGPGQALL